MDKSGKGEERMFGTDKRALKRKGLDVRRVATTSREVGHCRNQLVILHRDTLLVLNLRPQVDDSQLNALVLPLKQAQVSGRPVADLDNLDHPWLIAPASVNAWHPGRRVSRAH